MGAFAAFICAVFPLAGAHPARAGVNVWTSKGPYGGSVNALAIDPTTPSTPYAGTDGGGVFQSTISGGSWSGVSTGLAGDIHVSALVIDPHTPGSEQGLESRLSNGPCGSNLGETR